jgi:hypothetical protein
MPGLLLHICCAPCLCYPYRALTEQQTDFAGFWFNPNVHPYKEYQSRLASVKDFSKAKGLDVIYDDSYPLEENISRLLKERCPSCYSLRLEATAREALQRGYGGFTTTLLYSIYQKHELIREVGTAIGQRLGVKFEYHDFRKGWEPGRDEARRLELYRQKYCGCVFSERDRYRKAANTSEKVRDG